MRSVLDTNVFISAFVFGGNPRLIVELAERGTFTLITSGAIRVETERVLLDKFLWSRSLVAQACEPTWKLARTISPTTTIAVARDDDDNRILECAVDAHADAIVTGDQGLLQLHPFRGITIVSPADFLRRKIWRGRPR